MTIPSIIGPRSITVFVGGKPLTTTEGNPNFAAVRDYIKAGGADPVKMASLFDIKAAITTATNGMVVVKNDTVFYDGKPLHTTLTARMLNMLSQGYDIKPLSNFLEKLMKNPSNRAVTGLYDFLAATHIPITPEGNFLAYKKVRNNYLDIHSGTIRNAVGDEPRVSRNQVDEDPDRTCSHGLHVCSYSYLRHFGSTGRDDRIVIVEVNPADVVAIPRDYNNAKMRCAGYKVIGEVTEAQASTALNAAVMGASNFTAPAPTAADAATLSIDETDVIRDIEGTPVRFYLDDDVWVAEWTNADGDENEESFYAEALDEAISLFRTEFLEEVQEWTAQVRWLDDDGELQVKVVTITIDPDYLWGDEPDDSDFTDALEDYDFDMSYRVVDKTAGRTVKRVG